MKSIHTMMFVGGLLVLIGCKNAQYLQASYTGEASHLLQKGKHYSHTLQPDDKITVSIWNHDQMSIGSLFSIYNSNESYGKWILVDSSGNINLPQIGQLHVAGYNCMEVTDTLTKLFSVNLIHPIIVVKVLNREVTVLGEVKSPGNYILEKEKNTLTEILGKAEGTTDYSNLKSIQIVRKDTSYLINLTKFPSNYLINLEAQDVVYIPPKRGKIIDQKAPTIIPFASAITAAAVFFSVLKK